VNILRAGSFATPGGMHIRS